MISETVEQPIPGTWTLESAHRKACQDLLAERKDGYWTGELSASALSTATACSVLALCLKSDEGNPPVWMQEQLDAGIDWLAEQQNEDGGWGDTSLSHSNISTTLLSIAAIHLAGKNEVHSVAVQAGWKYVDQCGGWDGLKARYGKDKTFAVPILANCAIAGLVPWSKVSALPFELACVPQKFYRFVQMPVVSYAIPALVAIGQAKYFADPPRNPFTRVTRKFSVARSLRVLEKMQPESGGYLEAIPLTCFVAMALIHSGRRNHPVVERALRFVYESFRDEGSWPIDTNLATWVTTLSINALAAGSEAATMETGDQKSSATFQLGECNLDWLLSCQFKEVHPFTGSEPGGWGWSDLCGAVPDADDTPGALLALRNWYDSKLTCESDRRKILEAASSGVRWLLRLQNRDHGWPTFCRGWGKLPFDRSGTDITAHAIRALSRWKKLVAGMGATKINKAVIDAAIRKGVNYLTKTQEKDGSWNPLWFGNQDNEQEDNPVYGTAKVLTALIEIGVENNRFEAARTDTRAIQKGLIWLVENQQPGNDDSKTEDRTKMAGWGGGASVKAERIDSASCCDPSEQGIGEFNAIDLGNASIEETAIAVDTLLLAERWLKDIFAETKQGSGQKETNADELVKRFDLAVDSGLKWLIFAVYAGKHSLAWPIGFYFAKLWYYEKLYPLIYTTAALTRAVENGWVEKMDRQQTTSADDETEPSHGSKT